MAEILTLATPEVTQYTTAGYRIAHIGLFVLPTTDVVVHLIGENGERIEVRAADPTEAQQILQQLNTANLSVKSLQRRCLEWCASKMARLAGTVVGVANSQ